ncbi:hypothetical protein FBU30_006843 [Linnemannia zychae]|nr:hypothetical protein FBU30_006843 [Linnemannia zychae]
MANPSIEEVEVGFTSNTDFAFKQLKRSVEVTLSDKLPDEIASNADVFALSNTYGYFVASQNEGFIIDKLSSLRSAFENGEADAPNKYSQECRVEISGETISHIRLSADELTVIIGLRGGLIYLYSATKLLSKTKGAKPAASINVGTEIRDIHPNPAMERNGLMAVLLENRTIKMINLDGTVTATLDKHKYTAIAWSSKGKQIMCGTETVVTISWLETSVFIVVYNEQPEPNGDPSPICDFCVISKEDKTKTKVYDYRELCFPMPNDICGSNYYVSSSLKTLSKNFKEFLVAGFSASTDMAVIARGQDGEWVLLDLPEVDRPLVHGIEPCLMGMAIDLTSTQSLEPLEEEGPEASPAPILYVYNNFGQLSAYNIFDLPVARKGLPCASMVQIKPLPQIASGLKTSSASKATSSQKTTPVPKITSATPLTAKPTASTAAPQAETKATPAFSFGAAVTASKPAPSPSAGFKPTTTAGSAVSSKPSFASPPASAFSTAQSATPKSFAPNPIVNPNPAFQQNTLASSKPSGSMQKILQENEPPLRLVRKKSVVDTPSTPAPKVSPAMDALSRQLESTYLAMTEELKTLHSHVKETEDLVKAREHVFGELDQFLLVIEKRIKAASDTKDLAKSVMDDFSHLKTDLVKVRTKREEIEKLLKAREDPSLLDKVMTSELNPAQAALQDHMKRSIETVDRRISDMEQHIQAMNSEATKLRQGQVTEPPTLDAIRRSIRHISTALISRQSDLDQLSNDIDTLVISNPIKPQEVSTSKPPSKVSVVVQSKSTSHSQQSLSISEHGSTEQSKRTLARELRRVFTSNPQATAILNTPSSSTPGIPLSVLPKLKEIEYIPVFEPRRSERKKRLLASVPSQPEIPSKSERSSIEANPSSVAEPLPATASAQISSQPTPSTAPASTSLPSFGFNTAGNATSTFSAATAPSFGTPSNTTASTKAAPVFGSPSLSGSGSAPASSSSMSFGSSTMPSFSGFQIPKSEPATPPSFAGFSAPKSEPASTPAFTGFQVPKTATTAAPAFPAASTNQPAWSFAKTSTPPQTGFTGFQVPSSMNTPTKITPAPTIAPTFSFANPVQTKESEVKPEVQEEDAEDEEEVEHDEYQEGDEEEEEIEDEDEGQYDHVRYEHDGQVYELDDDESEPETWGSDTDQRDYDQGDEEEQEEEDGGEENQGDQSEGEETPSPAPVISDKKDTPAKNAWAAPGFSFPATAPVASSTPADSSKPTFSFLAAVNRNKESGAKTTPVTQSPFGTASGVNTFGSTTTFAFGTPQTVASKPAPAPVSAFGQKPLASSPDTPKSAPASKSQGSDNDEDSDQGNEGSNEEDKQEEEELGSEVEEEAEEEDFDENGSEADEEDVEDHEDSDKESALTAVQLKSSITPSLTSTGKTVSMAPNTEASSIDFSKIGFGNKGNDAASPFAKAVSSDKPLFGSAPAFSSASDVTSSKSPDVPFIKPPRSRKESRDSLDSNTSDEEDRAVLSGSAPASPILGTGKTASDTKGASGGLDSFNLSLGGESTKTDKKPSWGESSFSSWGTASQSSAPQSAWGSTSILGSSQSASTPASSASPFAAATATPAVSTSPFAAAAATSATSASPFAAAGATGGGFGQTSTLGGGFGGSVTGFGQTSQPTSTSGSGFGQTSQLASTTGFGAASKLGTGTGFGQTSVFGSGGGFGQTSTAAPSTGFGQTSTLGSGSGFGQTSTLGSSSGFGQTSAPGSSSGFGQTSTLGSSGGFGQSSKLGSGLAFGQSSQMGSGFGQTAFGQPSQIAGGVFGQPAPSAIASASMQSNFGSFASAGTNAFAAAQSNVNVLDQQAGGSVFGSGSGFEDSGKSTFGSGGFGGSNTGFGGSNAGFGGTNTGFGGANTGFGGASTGFGGASTGFGGANTGFGGASTGGFGSTAGQTSSGFGNQSNVNTNKPSFSGFR